MVKKEFADMFLKKKELIVYIELSWFSFLFRMCVCVYVIIIID